MLCFVLVEVRKSSPFSGDVAALHFTGLVTLAAGRCVRWEGGRGASWFTFLSEVCLPPLDAEEPRWIRKGNKAQTFPALATTPIATNRKEAPNKRGRGACQTKYGGKAFHECDRVIRINAFVVSKLCLFKVCGQLYVPRVRTRAPSPVNK